MKLIERAMGWQNSSAAATTPRTLIYRLIAATLSAHIDDRERWDVAAAYCYGGFEDWPALFNDYQGCRLALQNDTSTETPASTRVWVITRGSSVVSLLSDMGLKFSTDSPPVDLMAEYGKRRRLGDALSFVTR